MIVSWQDINQSASFSVIGQEYDLQAAKLESDLRREYPKLQWRVLRKEEISDSPKDFYTYYVTRLEIRCKISGLDWQGAVELDRHLWDQVSREWILKTTSTRMVHLFTQELLGK